MNDPYPLFKELGLRPFNTGSRTYGTPHEDSDFDVVVRVTQQQMLVLVLAADIDVAACHDYVEYLGVKGIDLSLRFGRYNVLCVTTEAQLGCWTDGTLELQMRAPVTREEAVATFQRLFKERL